MKRAFVVPVMLAFFCACAAPRMSHAQDRAAPAAAAPAATAPSTTSPGVTVAILDFDTSKAGNPDLGKQITEALTAVLSGESGFTLVDRSSLNRTLQEHELNLTGLVNPDQAAQIGKLVGAKIVVTGKSFLLEKTTYVTAKIVGTETGLVEGILVKGGKDADTGELVMSLSTKLADRLRETGPKLVAAHDTAPDPLIALQEKLKGKTLPKIGILFVENHVSNPAPPHTDPAVETEIKTLLNQAGFTVIEGDAADWDREGVENVVNGEAFSEAAMKIGSIMSCSARVELKVVERKSGKLLLSTRTTSRAADLSEQMAAKTALQKAAHALGLQVLEYYAKGVAASQP